MQRTHLTSKQSIDEGKRLDSRKHKNWSCLEVMVCYHQGCYWIEIRIDSLPGDGSHSKVRFRNRVNKYMKAMSDILPNPKNHRWSTDRETCSKIETESNVIDVAVFWVEDEDRHINS